VGPKKERKEASPRANANYLLTLREKKNWLTVNQRRGTLKGGTPRKPLPKKKEEGGKRTLLPEKEKGIWRPFPLRGRIVEVALLLWMASPFPFEEGGRDPEEKEYRSPRGSIFPGLRK